MSLTAVRITDYQSHKSSVIQLGRLTVVTGPTGSGKSAVRRAIELAAFNARGSSYVRRGAKRCAVALVEREGGVTRAVLIRRGAKSTAGDFYRLVTGTADGKDAREYTKLAGQVPEKVAGVLRLSPVNFAGQFDAPYLLTQAGTEAARTLGELTNVSMVFAAAAEAGRRRKQLDRDARTAQARLDGLREQAKAYEGLQGRQEAAQAALEACAGIERDAARLERLRALTARLQAAQEASRQARLALAAAEPPDLSRLEAGLARLTRLGELTAAYRTAERAVASWAGEAKAAAGREEAAHRAVHAALAAAGQCPMCGQKVEMSSR